MLRRLVLATTLAASLGSALHAQRPETPPHLRLPQTLDSGALANPAAVPVVLFQVPLRYEGAAWLQLHLGELTMLPAGSYLRIRAAQDGAEQRHDARSLASWASNSALFNGEELSLELIAAPGTTGNRVDLAAVTFGLPTAPPETICGPLDDRQQSNDPRQGRLWRGCTGWLIGPDLMLTAGHCVGGTEILELNVPNSTASGSVVRAHPDDQYPFQTLASLNSGVGSDWGVCRVGRNSNHGQLPTERNGGVWYRLGSIPGAPAGQTIRITGYGTSSAVPTLSQVQKTHTGPLSEIRATSLCYATDTTGGNSGSPILHENTGDAIGIHTHGGCTSTGGCNQGTRIDRGDLQQAIAAARQTPGSFTLFGAGCSGSGTTPSSCAGWNETGGTLDRRSLTNEYAYPFTLAQTGTVTGFELYCASVSGSPTSVPAAIYASNGTSPTGAALATTTLGVGGAEGFYAASFATPLSLPAGSYFLSADTNSAHPSTLTGGNTLGVYWRRPFGSGSWALSSSVTRPSFRVLCQGGGQPGAVPALGADGTPLVGSSFTLRLARAAASAPCSLIVGASRQSWGAIPLPLALDGAGAPGCALLVSADVFLPWAADASGAASLAIAVPNDATLIGAESHTQVFVLDLGNNALNLAASNAGTARIGG